jgi:hypothetical protein
MKTALQYLAYTKTLLIFFPYVLFFYHPFTSCLFWIIYESYIFSVRKQLAILLSYWSMPILYSFHLLVKFSGDWWLKRMESRRRRRRTFKWCRLSSESMFANINFSWSVWCCMSRTLVSWQCDITYLTYGTPFPFYCFSMPGCWAFL